MQYRLTPRSKDIEKLFDDLMKYPMRTTEPHITQQLSRYKTIRIMNRDRKRPKVAIRKGIVGLQPNVRIKKVGKEFIFDIF